MSNNRYILDLENENQLRSTARLLSAGSARYGGDWHSQLHAHNYAELFYTVDGKGQFRIGDDFYPVEPGHLVIINPNVLHTEVSYNLNPLEYIVLGIEGLELSPPDGDSRYCILDYKDGDIQNCLRSILREMESRQAGYEAICQAYLEILIVRLMRHTSFSIVPVGEPAKPSRPCAAIRRYIDDHYKEQITLDQLAAEAHVNKYYLAHTFREEYGISPISYMNARRIGESKYLLRETDLSLSQIAQILGFSSASYFSQSFRRAEAVTPMEYRKQAKDSGESA